MKKLIYNYILYMAIPINTELYEKIKREADNIYKKNSAYKSGFIIKQYKAYGGLFKDDDKSKRPLQRWFLEKWSDIGNKEYPVYRPSIRINKDTPLTIDEIDPINLKEQIKLKQIIKGNKNLPAFKGKGINNLIKAVDIPKTDELYIYSNPKQAQKQANKYLGNIILYKSDKPDKKYMLLNPNNNKWVYFGQMKYFDYLKHKNYDRMLRYRARAENIKGNWKNNLYSPNNLSINILW